MLRLAHATTEMYADKMDVKDVDYCESGRVFLRMWTALVVVPQLYDETCIVEAIALEIFPCPFLFVVSNQ